MMIRYDVLHLISTLPSTSSIRPARGRPVSPAGSASTGSSWDSLPSDLEETFDLSSEGEHEEYERQKKTRWIEKLREERLKEREKEDDLLQKEEAEKRSIGCGEETMRWSVNFVASYMLHQSLQ